MACTLQILRLMDRHIDRRDFLVATVKAATSASATLILAPFAITALNACGDGSSDLSSPISATVATTPCDGVAASSNVVASHTHGVCVPTADFDPPAGSTRTYVTSEANGHTHSFTLSTAELEQIRTGVTVTANTTTADGHTHAFALTLAAPT